MVLSLLGPIIFFAIIALIVAGSRADSEKGGEEMIKNVYKYLVLFATLMMIIGGSIGAFMAVADIIAPAPYYQTFEDFMRWEADPSNEKGESKLSTVELRERYEVLMMEQKKREIERAKNSLIKSIGWVAIPLPFFLYFQRNLRRKED